MKGDDLRRICADNPVGPDGKRIQGRLDLRGVELQVRFEQGEIDLSDADLREAKLRNCYFWQVLFCGSDLTGADIDETHFYRCDFDGATLRDAKGRAELAEPSLAGSVVAGVDFRSAKGISAPFGSIDWHLALWDPYTLREFGFPEYHNKKVPRRDFSGYDFSKRDLGGFDFRRALLSGGNFQNAKLLGADLEDADLTDADLKFADLTGAKVTAEQVLRAKNWLWANVGSDELPKELHLPPDYFRRSASNDFRGSDFTKCNFQNNPLAGLNFEKATLRNADLSGQDLTGTHLDGTDLTGADLRGAKLKDATGLVAWQFRGTDVTDAELPDRISEFQGAEQVGKIGPAVAKQFLAMLAACLYCLLTIASTTDVALILGSATLPLPVVQTPIRIAGFYWFAPLVLIIVFLYFQLNLNRMWEALAKLPAIFSDGRRLDERVYPWMLIQKVRSCYQRLYVEYTFVPWLENFLGSALAYFATPWTLLRFILRALVKHDAGLTTWHVLLLIVSLLIAWWFYCDAEDTLRGVLAKSGWRYKLRCYWRWTACLVFIALLGIAASLRLYTRPAALVYADLSTKPDGWVDGQADISGVKGAELFEAHLEHAQMFRAFLVSANLEGAHLDGANLLEADLRGAKLFLAEMRTSRLSDADLEGANLVGADFSPDEVFHAQNWLLAHYSRDGRSLLHLPDNHVDNLIRRDFRGYAIAYPRFRHGSLAGAHFEGVPLDHADFRSADLSNAILRGCDLEHAVFTGAKLTKTDLGRANLGDASGLTEPQLREAILDAKTILPPAFQDLIPPPAKKKP